MAVAALSLTAIAAVSTTDTASASTCAATPTVLAHAPISQFALPGGASTRIWDVGSGSSRVRLAVVRVPAGTLTPTVTVAPTLSRAVTPQSMTTSEARAVVVINGGHFNPNVPGIPDSSQARRGVLRKATRTSQNGLAVDSVGKTVEPVSAAYVGSAVTTRGTWPLAGLNWQTLAASGITTYTAVWGTVAHPYGPRTVVVSQGKVVAIRLGSAGASRPGSGQTWLTAPSGTYATALARLRVGDSVTISAREVNTLRLDGIWPHARLASAYGQIGAGATLVVDRANKADCSSRNEIRRPRSGIAWLSNGDLLVVAVAGPAGTRMGGATVHQFADYLRRLGAVRAINLDGGTSTTLLVRKSVGGPYVRLDRAATEAQRPVVDSLAFLAPTA
jgi:hypothetical protein